MLAVSVVKHDRFPIVRMTTTIPFGTVRFIAIGQDGEC